MLKLYCQKCGALNAYVSEKPNFCQKCGKSFGEESQASLEDESENIEEKEEQETDFNLQNGLDVDIDTGRTNTDKLGSILGTAKEGQGMEGKPPAVDEKYTMEDFQREAGSIRGGNGPET
jgi:hypothetical protein